MKHLGGHQLGKRIIWSCCNEASRHYIQFHLIVVHHQQVYPERDPMLRVVRVTWLFCKTVVIKVTKQLSVSTVFLRQEISRKAEVLGWHILFGFLERFMSRILWYTNTLNSCVSST